MANSCECSTIYDKLLYINETKELIRAALEANDVDVLDSDTFRKYAEYIADIRKVKTVNEKQGDVIVEDKILSIDDYNSLEDKDKYTSYFISEEIE